MPVDKHITPIQHLLNGPEYAGLHDAILAEAIFCRNDVSRFLPHHVVHLGFGITNIYVAHAASEDVEDDAHDVDTDQWADEVENNVAFDLGMEQVIPTKFVSIVVRYNIYEISVQCPGNVENTSFYKLIKSKNTSQAWETIVYTLHFIAGRRESIQVTNPNEVKQKAKMKWLKNEIKKKKKQQKEMENVSGKPTEVEESTKSSNLCSIPDDVELSTVHSSRSSRIGEKKSTDSSNFSSILDDVELSKVRSSRIAGVNLESGHICVDFNREVIEKILKMCNSGLEESDTNESDINNLAENFESEAKVNLIKIIEDTKKNNSGKNIADNKNKNKKGKTVIESQSAVVTIKSGPIGSVELDIPLNNFRMAINSNQVTKPNYEDKRKTIKPPHHDQTEVTSVSPERETQLKENIEEKRGLSLDDYVRLSKQGSRLHIPASKSESVFNESLKKEDKYKIIWMTGEEERYRYTDVCKFPSQIATCIGCCSLFLPCCLLMPATYFGQCAGQKPSKEK